MKVTRLYLLCVMLALAGIAHAAGDKLTVQDVQMEPGSSVALDIVLENGTTNLMGWQCDIVLPAGLSLKLKANGKPAATLGDRFAETEHSISSSVTSTGAYRFIATSMDGEAIPGTGGTLFTVTLMADATIAEGSTFSATVKNIEFNTQDNQKLTLEDASFTVTVGEASSTTSYDLPKGWNWISTNLASAEKRDSRMFLNGIEDKLVRIVGQTDELINDVQYGLVGNLNALDVTASYKLHVSDAVLLAQAGAVADVNTPIAMKKGWNWIGYLPTVAQPVSTALKNLQASEGDRLLWQDGFAEYDGTVWQGDFTMQPGKGYMYYSKKDVVLAYSLATETPAGSRRSEQDMQEEWPWEYNAHACPDVMTMVAVMAETEQAAAAQSVVIGAFVGEECRGVGRWVGDKLFITVHGTVDKSEVISFRVFDVQSGEVLLIREVFNFDGQCLGSLSTPVVLHISNAATSIMQLKRTSTADVYNLNGQARQRLQRGVNIVVTGDGTVQKVIRK